MLDQREKMLKPKTEDHYYIGNYYLQNITSGAINFSIYKIPAGPEKMSRLPRLNSYRIDRYGACFFPYTGNLWNSLPPSVFPSS